MKFKLSSFPADPQLAQLLREVQDNVAGSNEVAAKADRVDSATRSAPKLKEMNNGEERIYYDGSNYWTYKRVGNVLLKSQWTEV